MLHVVVTIEEKGYLTAQIYVHLEQILILVPQHTPFYPLNLFNLNDFSHAYKLLFVGAQDQYIEEGNT